MKHNNVINVWGSFQALRELILREDQARKRLDYLAQRVCLPNDRFLVPSLLGVCSVKVVMRLDLACTLIEQLCPSRQYILSF
jgi:hypothetical protein